MGQEIIQVENLTIGYQGKQAKVIAEGLNGSIEKGKLTCLIGANGVGKSTLLRTLCSFQPKISGNIFIKDKPIESYSDKELSKTIGVVLTEKIEVMDMTAKDLIALGRNPYTGFWGKLDEEDKKIIDNAIQLIGIEGLSDKPIQNLSDGERQKVMIAKAIAQQTPIIILDEPTAFLDYPSKVEIMQLLHQLTQETNKAIFLSTHDLELALQLSDKLWLMSKEKGIEIGSTDELAKKGSLSTFFPNKSIVFDEDLHIYRIAK